jgi:K+-sensing histidine kinase KdpD
MAFLKGITDASWFKDNFSCVVQNAVKYNSGQKINIDFSMVNDMRQEFLHICVTDSGQRLSALHLLQLFDPPAQRRRSSLDGMGIGLVCLAERIKVRIRFKTSTTFFLVLNRIMYYVMLFMI